MKWGFKITRKHMAAVVIGFFVGRAVCFEMNPLAAGFCSAVMAEGLGSVWLFLAMLAGIVSSLSFSGGITFTIYAFLFAVALKVYRGKIKRPLQNKDWISVSILTGFCLFVTQVFIWSICGRIADGGLASNLQGLSVTSIDTAEAMSLRYLWSNRKMTILAIVEALLEGVFAGSICHILLSGFSGAQWQKIKAGGDHRKLFIAGLVLFAIILYGLPGSMYATFAIAESLCYFMILWTAYAYGVMESTLVAALGGAVLAYQLSDFNVLGIVTIFGLVTGLMREMGRIGIFSGLAMAALAVSLLLPDTGLGTNSLKGLVTAGVIFLFMPRSLLHRQEKEEELSLELVQEQFGCTLREKVRDLAGGFFKLQNGLLSLKEPGLEFSNEDFSKMYLQMKENVCDQCEHKNTCYEADPNRTFRAAKSVFLALDRAGGLEKTDIPQEFADLCDNQESFMIGANLSYEKAKADQIVRQKMVESRKRLAHQVGDIALLMNEFSSEFLQETKRDESREMLLRIHMKLYQVDVGQVFICKRQQQPDLLYVVAKCRSGMIMTSSELAKHISAVYESSYCPSENCKAVVTKKYEVYPFLEEPVYYVIKGITRISMEKDKNGDNFSFLNLPDGRFVVMLSDGMGTGESAYRLSALLVELLEEFLEAGFAQDMALNLANSVMAMNMESTQFTTLDYLAVDLYCGKMRMVKIGASATFIKRGNQVEMIISTSLPAGVFSTMDYDAFEYPLQDGDLVVMVSDGVMDAVVVEEKEDYVKTLLESMKTNNPQTVADYIVEQIRQKAPMRVKDDMTVLAFTLWKKKI